MMYDRVTISLELADGGCTTFHTFCVSCGPQRTGHFSLVTVGDHMETRLYRLTKVGRAQICPPQSGARSIIGRANLGIRLFVEQKVCQQKEILANRH